MSYTPQDKVNDLIHKFSRFNVGTTIYYLSKKEAKQVALIAVNEILNEGKMKFCGDGITDIHYTFWVEVRNIIINL